MDILRTPETMQAWSTRRTSAGESVGFVPTMGALHEGHASLIRASVEENAATVVSIFVNPTQFAPSEDFGEYPRTWETDKALCESLGADAIYYPDPDGMYPPGYATCVQMDGPSAGLESVTRPHFFRGVATVVTKLFNAVRPDRAYFGQKDAQQAAVITRMAADLDFGIEIRVMPIVREPDGLAMSSRNVYLSADERQRALALSRGLRKAESMLEGGERNSSTVAGAVREELSETDIDYVEIVNADTMEPVDTIKGRTLIAVAAKVGETRLIDNIIYTTGA